VTLNDWKSLSITQELMGEWKRRQDFAKEYLEANAGLDPAQDRFYCGVIAAYRDMLDIELDEEAHN
jgi:hypothetical protein